MAGCCCRRRWCRCFRGSKRACPASSLSKKYVMILSGGGPVMGNLPLEGLKIVDIAVLFAAPTISQNMGDFGAEVIKVEHPRLGDSLRTLGAAKNDVPLWWKITNRNKKCVTLDLNTPEGQEILKQLVAEADVLTENFRPGTLERWGLGWEVLHALNPRLVMVRVSGFGQTGPYKDK